MYQDLLPDSKNKLDLMDLPFTKALEAAFGEREGRGQGGRKGEERGGKGSICLLQNPGFNRNVCFRQQKEGVRGTACYSHPMRLLFFPFIPNHQWTPLSPEVTPVGISSGMRRFGTL